MKVGDVVDLSTRDTSYIRKRFREASAEPRRTHRKTATRVLFSDVMAQEREMERFNYEKIRYQHSASSPLAQLRKGETVNLPGKALKQNRAVERRSKRQKLRRNMSPRSPEGAPQGPLRNGVSLVELGENETQAQHKHDLFRNADAIQDATLHSTAWRNLKFAEAPANLLPDRDGILEPYALISDAPLEEFSDELKEKCLLSFDFLKPKPLTMMSGTREEGREDGQVEERVKQLVDEATHLVKKCHAARADAIIATTRQQIAVYLKQKVLIREKASTLVGMPLHNSRLKTIAAQRLCRETQLAHQGEKRFNYLVGKTDTGNFGHIYPEVVTYLSKVAPIPRSTTCMLSKGTHRVDDDPIIRFVPQFSPDTIKDKGPQFPSMGLSKVTLAGMDNEVNEYVLRYVICACGGDQAVFEALRRCGAFTQPFASYSDILARLTRAKLYKQLLFELEAQQHINKNVGHALGALKDLAVQDDAKLYKRLQPVPAHILSNYVQGDSTGLRHASSGRYGDLALKYQEFFCRRCCIYNCRNHGRGQPVPKVRVDPSYPLVKAATKLWRRVEVEQLADDISKDDVDDEIDDEQPFGLKEPLSEIKTIIDNTDKEEQSQRPGQDGGGELNRRSVRAHTAACTKASSRLRAIRSKKLTRFKTSDVSEYLGFDGVYQALIHDKKIKLLSIDMCCGPHCSKYVSRTFNDGESNGSKKKKDMWWEDSEVALLNQLEKCCGLNPCALAALIATRDCSEVADFFRTCKHVTQKSLGKSCSLRSDFHGQNCERSNGAVGNSFEHLRRTRSQRMKDRGANHEYTPCNHDGGSCDSALCSCMRRDHYCEKSCGCSPDCSNRFPGCHCEVGQCRTSACPCYYAARECDPDVCISCGACELPVVVADEESRDKSVSQLKICGNVNIMRGQMSKIGVSASETHGWGAFALENVKMGDFMYEYTGSLLSQDEAERRGNVYDKTTISFLFDLTEDSVVDATRKGNKSKFANHDSSAPKCFARIMLVNGDHRIGIYANQDIKAGDELFFDYGYSGVIPDWSQARIGSSKETAPVEDDDDNNSGVVGIKER